MTTAPAMPRPEYPRPQFVRSEWLCLNGEWQFEIDAGDSGRERDLLGRDLERRITVPFSPESELSGIGHVDFMAAVWYRREVAVPAAWKGQRVLLHFGAVDNDATVWASIGEGGAMMEVGRHRGGFTPFTCDLGDRGGEKLTLVVRARDDYRRPQPRGKQSQRYANHGCHYTRTTGIWQTVWMEPVPEVALKRPRITPDVANASVRLELPLEAGGPGPHRVDLKVRAVLTDEKGDVVQAEAAVADFSPRLDLKVPADRARLWSVEDPHLYGLRIELLDASGGTLDAIDSYAALRSVTLDGKAIRLNSRAVFQRLVLDQGYYPDGIMTAPSDAALVKDIELSMQAGFNGARLHQKVFEERFLYHCDRLGYLVWGEFGDWGADAASGKEPGPDFIAQWLEALERDYSHPSIIGWCPLNETGQELGDRITMLDDTTRAMFLATKAMDTTRPVLDASGYSHRVAETDIYDSHDYTQDPEHLRQRHAGTAENKPLINLRRDQLQSLPYRGQPYFVSEFGGIKWNPEESRENRLTSWGYGQAPQAIEDFYSRFEGQCAALLENEGMFGYCYTQLTDVFQEQNGIFFFDRSSKFELDRIRAAQQRPAAIEQETDQP